MTVYRVLRGNYNGYPAGSQFEATIDPSVERRALHRGSIEIVEESTPALRPGSFRLPKAADAAEGRADAHSRTTESLGRHGA